MQWNTDTEIRRAYALAREFYAADGIDTENVLHELASLPVSLPCWQGDDVAGFETGSGAVCDGGLLATGTCPGRARNGEELRCDLEQAMRWIPGRIRINLHAIYAETGGRRVERDALSVEHFQSWLAWAVSQRLALDFNATLFSHPLASSGWTLAHPDAGVREFWKRHVQCCRAIAAAVGERQGSACVHNLWLPDGSKDLPADRLSPRRILKESLDAILETRYSEDVMLDSLESKLFGIGSEAYVAGSHEFYLGYAVRNNLMLCLDAGHFHPTESIADKISALLLFVPRLLLHLSRGVRWDSDHVPILNDELMSVAQEVTRCEAFDRVSLALDFFDGSLHRAAAWVIGARAVMKAVLAARLEPRNRLREAERQGNSAERLALMEESKTFPWVAVWNYFCRQQDVGVGCEWIAPLRQYEQAVLAKRR